MTAGDRYLAADLGAIRALIVATDKMRPEDYRILGKVQEDVSWLNPAHEDNYYTAAAILPWNGELEAAQTILARAGNARYFDYQPAFYYAFHLLQFKGDAVGAAEWLRAAAEKLPDEDERLIMQNLAARWMDRAQDLDLAIRVVDAMAEQAKRKDFRAYLQQRVARLRSLRDLREAAERFRERFGRPPAKLRELVEYGLVPAIPADPFGFGFDLDKQGRIILRTSAPDAASKK
jgi:tetratricopeptide (TPR) repeat protein